MNKPNPLVPQGTFADKGKPNVHITVFAILAVHVVLLGVLLIAGCNKKDNAAQNGDPGLPPTVPSLDTNTWPNPPAANPASSGALAATTSAPVLPPVISNPPVAVAEPPPPPPPPSGGVTEHTIVKGDTFLSLGKQYKVGYKAIGDANPGVDPTRLKIGQKIKIPAAPTGTGTAAGTVSGAPGAGSASAGGSGETMYTVKSGDNLTKIAKDHGITARKLQTANNLPTTQIRVGQKLKIPAKAPPAAPPDTAAPPPSTPGAPVLDGTAPRPAP